MVIRKAAEVASKAGTATKKALGSGKGIKGFVGAIGINFALNVALGEPVPQAMKNSVTRDLIWDAAMVVAPGLAWGYMGLQVGMALGKWGYNTARKFESQNKARRRGDMNFNYTDTEQAATMRQAAVQRIQESKINARTALGKEAQLMHRGMPTPWR